MFNSLNHVHPIDHIQVLSLILSQLLLLPLSLSHSLFSLPLRPPPSPLPRILAPLPLLLLLLLLLLLDGGCGRLLFLGILTETDLSIANGSRAEFEKVISELSEGCGTLPDLLKYNCAYQDGCEFEDAEVEDHVNDEHRQPG